MPISLHEAFVPTALQVLHSVSGLVSKAEAHCRATDVPPATLISARFAPDMKDFAYQVKSCMVHTAMAVEGCMVGACSPDDTTPPDNFFGLRALIDDAIARLQALSPADVDALEGKPMRFTYGDVVDWSFTADQFLLSFSQPNFHFHATTAYDLLRWQGVPIGKMDYLGQLRLAG